MSRIKIALIDGTTIEVARENYDAILKTIEENRPGIGHVSTLVAQNAVDGRMEIIPGSSIARVTLPEGMPYRARN